MIEILLKKETAYIGDQGVYFDTSRFPDYGKLGNINLAGLNEGHRVEKTEKRNPTDFVLWKTDSKIGWPSPWGLGFPGWHIECSAMILKILGEQIDIHTGGIEHIPVHHNNEIAQSESATGKKPFAKFWLHRAHLKIDDNKIAKSTGTAIYLEDFKNHSLHPLAFRYWLLTAHYQTPANFTWESANGSQSAFEKIIDNYFKLPNTDKTDSEILKKFEGAIADNLNTPVTIALLQEAKSKKIINKMDKVLGLNIAKLAELIRADIPEEILELKQERDQARQSKDWQKSDELRKEIEKEGYILEDQETQTLIRKKLASLS
jgi:cysteinyl-tRNA synthetase